MGADFRLERTPFGPSKVALSKSLRLGEQPAGELAFQAGQGHDCGAYDGSLSISPCLCKVEEPFLPCCRLLQALPQTAKRVWRVYPRLKPLDLQSLFSGNGQSRQTQRTKRNASRKVVSHPKRRARNCPPDSFEDVLGETRCFIGDSGSAMIACVSVFNYHTVLRVNSVEVASHGKRECTWFEQA